MARKPAPQHFAGGKGPRQRVWDLIRATKGARFEVIDMVPGDVNEVTVYKYLKSLIAAGFVAPAEDRPGVRANRPHKGFRLVKDCGIDAPRLRADGKPVTRGLAQDQMWRTLRMSKAFVNAHELACLASTPAVPVSAVAAVDYLRKLHVAGYLARQEGRHKRVAHRYQLRRERDSGPRTPMVCNTKVLYDPNTDTTHAIERVTEEDAIYGK